ncbi:MAG TPA: ABC transporter substrate-binding protein, partial [Thermomicrobiales bacterium]|nr:ABC transporter substrate-binding protein [Thermomicrobiales bacterium]
GGDVVFGSPDDISTTNPLLASDSTSINILSQVFETLLGASPIDGRPVPGLADSWDVSADSLTYTFHLNTSATWQDGVDLTSADVLFSFDAALNPNLNSPYRSQIREVIKSYQAIDADTFAITASDRFVTFLYNGPAAVFIVPKHIWENVPVEQWSFDGSSTGVDLTRVVGTGPFKLTEWKTGERLTLSRNDGYYDQVPVLDTFTMVIQPDADTMVQALEQGDTDLVEILPAQQTAEVQGRDGLIVTVYPLQQVTYFVMNMDGIAAPAFSDQRVREAMYLAIDRQALTDSVFAGFGQPARGTQPPLSPGFDPTQLQPDYAVDPAKAKELLAAAGWSDTDGNGWVEKDGEELKLSLLYTGGDATVDAMVSYLQEAWKQIGVKVELTNNSGAAVLQKLNDHSFSIALLAFNLSIDGSQGLLFSCDAVTTGFNFGSYCNQSYDALDDQQLREFDPVRRLQLQTELAQIVWTDLPVGPLRFGVARTGYSNRIHNFHPNGYGFLWSLSYVWVDRDA